MTTRSQNEQSNLRKWIATLVGVFALVGSTYGFTCWYIGNLNQLIDKRVDCRIEIINIKLDMLLTSEQKRMAYEIWKMTNEVKGDQK